ncbi:MAG: hypothetical protein AB8Y25_02315 [Coxiella endosymbiont of Haemaphysalis qinghaiensis]
MAESIDRWIDTGIKPFNIINTSPQAPHYSAINLMPLFGPPPRTPTTTL